MSAIWLAPIAVVTFSLYYATLHRRAARVSGQWESSADVVDWIHCSARWGAVHVAAPLASVGVGADALFVRSRFRFPRLVPNVRIPVSSVVVRHVRPRRLHLGYAARFSSTSEDLELIGLTADFITYLSQRGWDVSWPLDESII